MHIFEDLQSGRTVKFWESPPPKEIRTNEDIPRTPTIFEAGEVKIRTTPNGTIDRTLLNHRVLLAHGIERDGKWTFLDGQDVNEFLNAYRRKHPDKPIDVIAVCNDAGGTLFNNEQVILESDPEFKPIYLYNSLLGVSTARDASGWVIYLTPRSNDGMWMNLPVM